VDSENALCESNLKVAFLQSYSVNNSIEYTPSTDGVEKFWISKAFLRCLSRGKIFWLMKKTPLVSTAIQSEELELTPRTIFEWNAKKSKSKILVRNVFMSWFQVNMTIFFELFFLKFLGQYQQLFSY